jgi:CO/xanthine dehydrogenase Mo-binding subunit
MAEEYAVIGKKFPRIDAIEKVTGAAQYLGDLKIPRMLYGKILRSPFPHARILRLDTSRAQRLRGVRSIVTGNDTRGIRLCVIPHLANKPPLAEDKARFIGDEIAAVAAETEDIAEEALDLIEVEYEELPGIYDPLEAMDPNAVKIHEEGNVAIHISRSYGNVNEAFKESDHIFEDQFETRAQLHCCLEPHGCIAHFDQSGHLTLWITTQIPHPLRKLFADAVGLPHNKVRIVKVNMGGAFGGRFGIDPAEVIAYFLSRKAGRPVRIINTHDEQFTTGRFSYPMAIQIKTGVKNDGTILAREVKVVTDNGAYNSHGIAITMGIGTKCTYLWGVPNVKYEADVVFTNKVYGGAFRGYGNPQITFAIESQMDMIAERLGIDMKDLCLKNANYAGQTTCMGHKITSCGQEDCIKKACEAIDWKEKRRKPGNRGVGIASLMHAGGGLRFLFGDCNLSDVFIKMNNDGTVDLTSGMAEIGQGSDTGIAQIVAEELGINMEDVNIITGDTSITPQCLGAWGSREIFIAGNAAKMAAGEIKQRLFEEASKILSVPTRNLVAKNRRVYERENPEKSVSIGQLATIYYNRGQILAARKCYDDPTGYKPDPKTGYGGVPTYAFGTHAIEVEVDRSTGKVKIVNFIAAHDLGKAINPMLVEGQIEGASLQGLGYALSEGIVWEEGIVLNPNFQDYRIFYINDAPLTKSIIVESIDPDGPYGAKGIAEAGLVPTGAAIANAIYDAVGVRIKSLPITPEKILAALKEKDERS